MWNVSVISQNVTGRQLNTEPNNLELYWLLLNIDSCLKAGLGLIGIVLNVVSSVVFYKQGLKDSVTISFFALALADVAASLTQMFTGVSILDFYYDNLPINFRNLQQIVANWSHIMFVRITMFITVYICIERCLCVAMPFLVKSFFTVRQTVFVIVIIYSSQLALYCYPYATQGLRWVTNRKNETRLVAWYSEDREQAVEYSRIVNGTIFPTIGIVTLSITTVIMIVQLNSSLKWRERNSVKGTPSSTSKESKVVKMVIIVAVIFLLCTLPDVILVMGRILIDGLEAGGRYKELNYVFNIVKLNMDSFNSILNIFVYYSISCRFRSTLHRIVGM